LPLEKSALEAYGNRIKELHSSHPGTSLMKTLSETGLAFAWKVCLEKKKGTGDIDESIQMPS
jgi:hypothetical protein